MHRKEDRAGKEINRSRAVVGEECFDQACLMVFLCIFISIYSFKYYVCMYVRTRVSSRVNPRLPTTVSFLYIR